MAGDDVSIRVEGVSKAFKLPHEKNTSLKSAFLNFYKGRRSFEKQQVLKDISFEVKKGEFFGIVGRNGSGKSTLLKLLAGIYTPDTGQITVNGKLTPFIELGVGFNPELTGRENVYLNGALLGFSRREMEAMYDEIVEFAELEKFMDQKLKNYSSGMQVRLAFSIAIQAKSDVLVLDEVLAVGDEAFQKKCIDIFENYKSEGQTLILVTHDMATVKKFCSQAILIDKGEIIATGDPNKVANAYTSLNQETISDIAAKRDKKLLANYKTRVKLVGANRVHYGDVVSLSIDYSAISGRARNIGVALYKNSGEYVFGTNTILDAVSLTSRAPKYNIKAELGRGSYHFKIGVFGETDKDIVEFIDRGPEFTVDDNSLSWEGLTPLEHTWVQ